jgi:predicted kinase
MQPIFIILGGPAIGKSTAAAALAASLPRSLHLPVDDIRHMVRGGLALPAVPWTEEITHQVTLGREAAIAVAERYAAAGFAVVVDDFWDPNGAREYRELLRRPGVHAVYLYAPRDVARARNRLRSPGAEGDYIDAAIDVVWDDMEAAMPRLAGEGWTVIDTSTLSPEQTAAEILALDGTGTAA